jgi:NAD+ kinase
MNIAIYGRPVNNIQIQRVKNVIEVLLDRKYRLIIHQPYADFLKPLIPSLKCDVFTHSDDLPPETDFLFSIGGDGTLLDTVFLVKDKGIPVAGINTGRLGFLSSIAAESIGTALQSLSDGHFATDPRTLIRLESNHPIFKAENLALNEFTLHKKDTSSMITIHTYLNGEYLNSYWADGIMISTPTGSTGYSLSCGGPIIVPQSETFVITPIAPHNLNVRPIVVSDKNVISLEVEGRSHHFMATLDSRSETIDSSCQIAIRKENYDFNLVRLNSENFLNTLRKKLNWGLDTRN